MRELLHTTALSDDAARAALDAALAKSRELGLAQVVAVLDDAGNLKAFARMDGAPVVSIDVARAKARAALLGVPTAQLFSMIEGDAALRACMPALPDLTLIGGGVPIAHEGRVIGAIGVGGQGRPDQDALCAEAGRDAVFE